MAVDALTSSVSIGLPSQHQPSKPHSLSPKSLDPSPPRPSPQSPLLSPALPSPPSSALARCFLLQIACLKTLEEYNIQLPLRPGNRGRRYISCRRPYRLHKEPHSMKSLLPVSPIAAAEPDHQQFVLLSRLEINALV